MCLTPPAHFSQFSINGPVDVVITLPDHAGEAVIRPKRAGITAKRDGNQLSFTIDQPGDLFIEIAGIPDLFLYACPPEEHIPDPADDDVVWFAAGQVHDVGRLRIEAGQTVYVEGGAILRGRIHAAEAENVRLLGRGIIDASHLPPIHSCRLMVFEGCQKVEVAGVTIGTPGWNTVFARCKDVYVHHYKCIGWHICSDGIDIVGSQDVLIEHCCMHSNDDCVVVKSVNYGEQEVCWLGDVRNVVVQKCVLYNSDNGNPIEIGYETSADVIEDIVFRDIDVIGLTVLVRCSLSITVIALIFAMCSTKLGKSLSISSSHHPATPPIKPLAKSAILPSVISTRLKTSLTPRHSSVATTASTPSPTSSSRTCTWATRTF